MNLVNDIVNDCAMTLLDGAPIDPDTGIAVPTIQVNTDGGNSIIDGVAGAGTVVDSVEGVKQVAGHINADGSFISVDELGNVNVWDECPAVDSVAPDYVYNDSSIPAVLGIPNNLTEKALGAPEGLTLLKEDPITPSEGMVNYITSDYQSGWMQGDIKGAWLADTEEGDIGVDTTTEHVVNGDFVTDVSGWTGYQGVGVISWDAGQLLATDTGAATSISTIIGQVYTILFDYVRGTTSYISFRIGSAIGGSDNANVSVQSDSETGFKVTFMATGTTTWLTFISFGYTGTFHVDNVSGKAIQNVVENGEFSSDRAWYDRYSTHSMESNQITVVNDAVNSFAASVYQLITGLTDGVWYKFSAMRRSGDIAGAIYHNFTDPSVPALDDETNQPDTVLSTMFKCEGSQVYVGLFNSENSNNPVFNVFENVQLIPRDVADRSVNDNPLQVIGELTRTPVASGAELVAYSGFSADNYLEQQYNPDLDFGTGDFYVMGWIITPAGGTFFMRRKYDDTGGFIQIYSSNGNTLARVYNLTGTVLTVVKNIYDNLPHFVVLTRRNGVVRASVDIVNFDEVTESVAIDANDQISRFGLTINDVSALTGSLSLWRMGKGAPTDEQIEYIYNMEKKLFEPGTKCTLLSGDDVTCLSSNGVTMIAGNTDNAAAHSFDLIDTGRPIKSEAVTGTPVAVSQDGYYTALAYNNIVDLRSTFSGIENLPE